jgi:hypothetical protein
MERGINEKVSLTTWSLSYARSLSAEGWHNEIATRFFDAIEREIASTPSGTSTPLRWYKTTPERRSVGFLGGLSDQKSCIT